MKVSIVVPVFNGASVLKRLYQSIEKALEEKFNFEVIFVFDGGMPESWNVVQELAEKYGPMVKGYKLKTNYGQHAATLFGIDRATGDYIVTMDEDLQHDPRFISEMIRRQLMGNYDVVYASFKQQAHRPIRVRLSTLLRRLLVILIPGIYPGYSSYRLIMPAVVSKIRGRDVNIVFIEGLLAETKCTYGSIHAVHLQQSKKESAYSVSRLISHSVSIIMAYSFFRKRNQKGIKNIVSIAEI